MKSFPKKRKTSKKKNRKPSAQQQFNDALERYQRFAHQNVKFEQEIRNLVERVNLKIQPHEAEKSRHLLAHTEGLVPFFSKKTLPEYLRVELFEWILGNINELRCSPFAPHDKIDELEQTLQKHCDQHLVNHQEKQFKKLAKQGVAEDDIEKIREFSEAARGSKSPEELNDILEELFGASGESLFQDDEEENDTLESLFEEDADFAEQFSAFEEQDDFEFTNSQKTPHAIEQLFKQSSINKLFRRIAKVIHPDLEQDEAKKAEKHQKMSQLIEARDNKNIAFILQTYKETFGALPDTFPDEDYTNLALVLKHLTQQLNYEKDEILSRIPHGHQYYDLFYNKNPKKEAAAIREYIQHLEDATLDYQVMKQEITSIPKLKDYLQDKMAIEAMQFFGSDDEGIPF